MTSFRAIWRRERDIRRGEPPLDSKNRPRRGTCVGSRGRAARPQSPTAAAAAAETLSLQTSSQHDGRVAGLGGAGGHRRAGAGGRARPGRGRDPRAEGGPGGVPCSPALPVLLLAMQVG